MLIFYLTFKFIICDGFNLVSNILFGNNCKIETEDICANKIWNYLSVFNIKGDQEHLFIQDILNLALVVLSIIFFFFYRKKQYHIAKVLDDRQQEENDFAILVHNIPLMDFPTKHEAKKMRAKNKADTMQLYHR